MPFTQIEQLLLTFCYISFICLSTQTHYYFILNHLKVSCKRHACLPQIFQQVFPKDKDIVLYILSPVFKVRKFFIDNINIGIVT